MHRPMIFVFAALLVGCGSKKNGSDDDTSTDPDSVEDTVEDTGEDTGEDAVPEVSDPIEEEPAVDPPPDPEEEEPSGDCPDAVAGVTEGTEVTPGTLLHLVADTSDTSIVAWEWSVVQPDGSWEAFDPGEDVSNPTFEVLVTGRYEFQLHVFDDEGRRSCDPWTANVDVIPDDRIYVELLWHTPGDSDQSDTGLGAGADVDLHFAHENASTIDADGDTLPDPWFDTPWDCYFLNPNPDWGSVDPMVDDNPRYVYDDSDGAGPEVVTLEIPEDGHTYTVGIHYTADNGFGASYATLRIYIGSTLTDEITSVMLTACDLWEAVTIDWPSGTVTRLTDTSGGHKIFTNYHHVWAPRGCD